MIKKKGILFWITGLSGSGKTSLAKKIFPYIVSKCGPTIHLDGDTLRNILNLHGYSYNDRVSISEKYCKILKLLTDQGINVVISLVCLIEKPRLWNKKNIKKYIEIYIKSNLNKIIKKNKKKRIYKSKKNIVGIDIKPEFPKTPNIIIENTFNKSLIKLNNELKIKINKLLKKNNF